MEDTNNRSIQGRTTAPPAPPPHKPPIIGAIKKFFSRHPEPEPNINPDEYAAYRETTIGKK